MITEELNRFDRTLSILVLLQSRKLVKAQQLADRFGVSLRTIYRDIRSLEAAGVPIIGEAGSGYSIMEGYRLPPVMFSREEASSFVAAEKLMSQFTDRGLGAHFESAMRKIRSVLKGGEKDWLAALDAQVWVRNGRALFNEAIPNALEILFRSIALQQQVYLEYRSFTARQPQVRHIEPVGVFHEHDHWYLYAFCHLRNEYRQFRTDRIVVIRPTDQPFIKKHNELPNYEKQEDSCPKTRVVIAVTKGVMRYLESGKKYYGFVSQEEKDEEVELVFETYETLDGLARWYLMFGDCARVIEPAAFKEKVQALLEKTSANLQR
jgi:predicted DNA-binding transcriptional regulator YafY